MKVCSGRFKNSRAASAAVGLASLPFALGLALTSALTSIPCSAASEALSVAMVVTTRMDLNQATRAEIEAVRGVGVELTDRLLAARERGPFQDWGEARKRVKGLGKRALMGFAEAGFHIRNQPPPSP